MMKRGRLVMYEALVFVFLLGFFTTSALAENGDLSLRLWGQYSPFISGDAGSGEDAPDYDDAFDSGWGGGIEAAYRPSRYFSCLIGAGYEHYSGDDYHGISFDSWDIFPIYLGGKIHLNPKESKWNPYLRMNLGAAHLSSVDVSYHSLKEEYWDSSWVFLFGAGAGVEYRWNRWGASLDVKVRYLGEPDSALGDPSEADSSWTIPIVFGINYHF